VFNSAVDWGRFFWIETSCGGDVDHHTAFLPLLLSHILEGQKYSAVYSFLEKSIKMHCVRNYGCDWSQRYRVFNVVYS